MTKIDIINKVSEKTGLPKVKAEEAVETAHIICIVTF